MPIETDCSNLLKHINDASDGLELKIKSSEEELGTLKILQNRRMSLTRRIHDLQQDVDDYMDAVGSFI